MKHSATGKTPIEATKKENQFSVKMKIASQANKTRKYPQQIVKLYRKKARTEKERGSKWGKETYTVTQFKT